MSRVKTVLVGAANVGKTCIAERILHDEFCENSFATVGAANLSVSMTVDGKEVIFNIWDTAGQERYRSLAPMYFSGAQVAMLVFDITSHQSFIALSEFYDLLEQRAPEGIVYVLVGNKSDLTANREVTKAEAEDYSTAIGAAFYIETSAKTGEGVRELFQKVAGGGYIQLQPDEAEQATVFPADGAKSDKKCC